MYVTAQPVNQTSENQAHVYVPPSSSLLSALGVGERRKAARYLCPGWCRSLCTDLSLKLMGVLCSIQPVIAHPVLRNCQVKQTVAAAVVAAVVDLGQAALGTFSSGRDSSVVEAPVS